jgi:hypothetical protein
MAPDTVPPFDAWCVRRQLLGQTINGELQHVSPALARLASHLNGLPTDLRKPALDGFLCGRSQADEDAIIRALADVDPEVRPALAEAVAAVARYKMTCFADIEEKPVEWLWRGRVPLGMLTLFAGDPKLGKSFVTTAIAASVSLGARLPFGDDPDGSGDVILFSAEDDASRTTKPRLRAAGADMTRIHVFESVILDDGAEALPSLRHDIDRIREAVASKPGCRLVVIDPVSAFVAGTDDHKNAELRGLLSPLKKMAEETGAAVLLVHHLNKSGGTNGKHRVTGSIAYVGACRANFLFARDRDDPTGGRVLMLDNGCNLAGDVPTLGYHIEDRGAGPAVEWGQEALDIRVEQALAAESDDPDEQAERRDCDLWLRDMLAHGPVSHADIVKAGKFAGFGVTALNRSKRRIKAWTDREGFGKDSKCSWTLTPRPPDPDRPELSD